MNINGLNTTCIKADQFFVDHDELKITILSMFRKDTQISDSKLCKLMNAVFSNQYKDGYYYLVKFNDQCGIEVYYTKVLNINKVTPSDLLWKDMANGDTISKIFSGVQAIQFFIEEIPVKVGELTMDTDKYAPTFEDGINVVEYSNIMALNA